MDKRSYFKEQISTDEKNCLSNCVKAFSQFNNVVQTVSEAIMSQAQQQQL